MATEDEVCTSPTGEILSKKEEMLFRRSYEQWQEENEENMTFKEYVNSQWSLPSEKEHKQEKVESSGLYPKIEQTESSGLYPKIENPDHYILPAYKKTFKELMREHVELTIELLIAATSVIQNKDPKKTSKLKRMKVRAIDNLIDNKKNWISQMELRGVSPLVSKEWYNPGPPNPYGSGIFLDHSLSVLRFFEALAINGELPSQELKEKQDVEVDFLLGDNLTAISKFWAMKDVAGADESRLFTLWRRHIQCTAKYADSYLSKSEEFKQDVMSCVEQGEEIGTFIDGTFSAKANGGYPKSYYSNQYTEEEFIEKRSEKNRKINSLIDRAFP
ncbi:MAG TPA: hypothetical protein ENI23_04605, partial [bacterium]|nr:hypothetical protein [bacterium]